MIIRGNSITECWLKAVIQIVDGNSTELSPVVVSFRTGMPPPSYKEELERDLNHYLQNMNKGTINTTANTIFPKSLSGSNQKTVYERFDKVWPYIKRDPENRHGHYFRRLMAYDEQSGRPVNQLQHIIDTYNKGIHKRSALIASTFDPTKDHVSQPRRGFPCLQQVCFVPKLKEKTLDLNAIYAMQHLSDRAYGNYLGLESLGNFMAREMGLKLDKVNCIASVLELKMTKGKAKEIINPYRNHVK